MGKTINKTEDPNGNAADEKEVLSPASYRESSAPSPSESGASGSNEGRESISSPSNEARGPCDNMNERKDSIASGSTAGSDSDWDSSFDPMVLDFERNFGIHDPDDAGQALIGRKVFAETRTKDVPCQFHDGVSGRCFKGSSCVYGHELGTGGRYDAKHPQEALAKAIRKTVTFSGLLPYKSVLEKEAEIFCEITHVEDPYRFFIRPFNEGGKCSCTKIQDLISKLDGGKDLPLDYFKGYASEVTTEETGKPGDKWKDPKMIDEKIHTFLQTALTYKKYQEESYEPWAELVAVRINQRWCRAVMLPSFVDLSSVPDLPFRAQVLETGEKVKVGPKDICKLPEQFSAVPTGVFRCSLFGISPVWGTWSSGCTKLFKDLIKDKKTKIIVKIVPECNRTENTTLFETRPYSVKIMFAKGEKWIDVAEEMNQAGHGLPWNPFPKRPFATRVIDTKGIDFIYTQGHKLPNGQLELENRRLGFSSPNCLDGRGIADDDSDD